ncbi:hypothetical protein DRO48_00995 [Candidatus Bathyarchaeota archaeon]|nr:MAG: hypothetical protein DRO48_00995 [Candidatus Bathyarchaeota archaeon]
MAGQDVMRVIEVRTNRKQYLYGGIDCLKHGAINARVESASACFCDDFWQGGPNYSWAERESSGNYSTVPGRPSGWISLNTNNNAGAAYSLYLDNLDFLAQYNPSAIARMEVPTITNVEVRMGFIGAADDDFIYFIYNTGEGHSTWHLRCDNGSGSPTDVDTGVSIDSVPHTIMFEFYSQVRIDGYVDGNKVGELTSKIPTNPLGLYMYVKTLENGVKSLYCDMITAWQDRY